MLPPHAIAWGYTVSGSVKDAARLFRESLDALSAQRKQIREDLAFSDPSNPDQWDEDVRRARETDPGGSRPCLVFDQTGQYCANVAGQVEQRPPAIHTIPVSDGADVKAAEQIDGCLRYIEYASRAQAHYTRALTSAARTGVGYIIVRPQLVDRALNLQEPRISSEGDPLKVVFDPWSVEIDGSDASFAFLLTPVSHRTFEELYGKRKRKQSFGEDDDQPVDTAREDVVLAEYWRAETETRDMVRVRYDSGDEESITAAEAETLKVPAEVIGTYRDKHRCVYWSLMSGHEMLQEEILYPASSIGVIPVYGYVGWTDGRMTYCGIPRRARAPQQAYNYHMSEIRAFMAQAPKSPWVIPQRGVRGLEYLWDRASVESRAYLPYNDIDDLGQPITPPTRAPLSINLGNHTQGAEQAIRDIQASIGMYQANLGAPSNESSGVAINERKQQGEASTAHFPAHLSASLTQVGRVTLDMLVRTVDSRRQLRVLSIDGKASSVLADPRAPRAFESGKGSGIATINPATGKYDVRVVVGGNFATQRQQAQQAYTEMMRANPAMVPALAPLWAQTLDVPHADKLSQVLTAMAPDPVRAILNPQEQEDTAGLRAKIDELSQALQEAIAVAEDAQRELDEARGQIADKDAELTTKENETAIKAYDAETKRIQVIGAALQPAEIQALVTKSVTEILDSPDPWPGEQEQLPPGAHESAMAPEPEPEPAQPAGPSEDVKLLVEQGRQQAEMMRATTEAIQSLAQAIGKPRRKVPVRGTDGYIAEVIDIPEG